MACLPSAHTQCETGTILNSTFLQNLGVNCNLVLNYKHFPQETGGQQVFTLELNPPFHQSSMLEQLCTWTVVLDSKCLGNSQ